MSVEKILIKEVVGIFCSYNEMEHAIDDLQIKGFERRQISVLGSEKAVEERFGSKDVKAEFLQDNPDTPRSPDIKREELGTGQGVIISGGILTGVATALIISGGILTPNAAVIVLAGGTGGAAIGGIFARMLGDRYKQFFQHQLNNGGLLLWVTTPDPETEAEAKKILQENGAKNVHMHEIPLAEHLDMPHPSKIFGTALVELDMLMKNHCDTLAKDQVITTKLMELQNCLKQMANTIDDIQYPDVEKLVTYTRDIIKHSHIMATNFRLMVNKDQTIDAKELERIENEYNLFAKELVSFLKNNHFNTIESISNFS